MGFIEVETTIAPELHLKQLVVDGLDLLVPGNAFWPSRYRYLIQL
jgi:hypothetical protein